MCNVHTPLNSLLVSQMNTAHLAICLRKRRCKKGAFKRKPSRQSAQAALAVERRSDWIASNYHRSVVIKSSISMGCAVRWPPLKMPELEI